jgi:DNA-binding response OmpR family regulator
MLVVDDDEEVLRFMAMHLAHFGFEAHLAHSGDEALRRIGARHFEFVFLATGMDGLDGFHTCRLIKREPYPHARDRPTVVLMLPGDAPVDRVRAHMADADAWLAKPLDAAALLRVVGEREARRLPEATSTRASSTVL